MLLKYNQDENLPPPLYGRVAQVKLNLSKRSWAYHKLYSGELQNLLAIVEAHTPIFVERGLLKHGRAWDA